MHGSSAAAPRVLQRKEHSGQAAHRLPGQPGEQHVAEARGDLEPVLAAEALRALADVAEHDRGLCAVAKEQQSRREVPRPGAKHLHVG